MNTRVRACSIRSAITVSPSSGKTMSCTFCAPAMPAFGVGLTGTPMGGNAVGGAGKMQPASAIIVTANNAISRCLELNICAIIPAGGLILNTKLDAEKKEHAPQGTCSHFDLGLDSCFFDLGS